MAWDSVCILCTLMNFIFEINAKKKINYLLEEFMSKIQIEFIE